MSRFGMGIDENGDISLPYSWAGHGVSAQISYEPVQLLSVLSTILKWLPGEGERLFWLKNWDTHFPMALRFFEDLRSPTKHIHLIDAPGQLISFDSKDAGDSERADAYCIGLLHLVTSFEWEAHLVDLKSGDSIFISDGFLSLLSDSNQQLRAAENMMKNIGMIVRSL
jgi:hypothetical protein